MSKNLYESRQYLNEYYLFHYAHQRDQCPYAFAPRDAARFHERIVPECLKPIKFAGPTRGLDIGCAVGRLTFELAGVVDQALGIDNAASLVRGARRMARQRQVTIDRYELAGTTTPLTIKLPRGYHRRRVRFKVGDAQALTEPPAHVVLAINLTCRLPRPRKFLEQLPHLVVRRGQLVLGSPHTWMTRYTARRHWLNADQILELLHPAFRLVRRKDLPFLIRETARKYQWTVSDVMTFQRRATDSGS